MTQTRGDAPALVALGSGGVLASRHLEAANVLRERGETRGLWRVVVEQANPARHACVVVERHRRALTIALERAWVRSVVRSKCRDRSGPTWITIFGPDVERSHDAVSRAMIPAPDDDWTSASLLLLVNSLTSILVISVKTVVYDRFGPPEVLRVVEGAPRPSPGPHDVIVRIHATTVTSAESAMRRGRPLWGRVIIGVFRPRRSMRTLGIELAGVIDEVGASVTRFAPGDEVFGFAGFSIGANAEYMRLSEHASLARKPTRATFGQAAAVVDGASTALYFLRDKAGVREGQRVLVVGASGSIGTYAVQLARRFGAHVTGVCGTANVELVRELGAHEVIDYTREDFTRRSEAWDVVFDTVGVSSFGRSRGVLTPRGCYVATTGLHNYLLAAWTRLRGGKRVITGMSVDKNAALPFIADLVDREALKIVIDRVYGIDDIVEAHRYVDSGRKRGNVVIEVRG